MPRNISSAKKGKKTQKMCKTATMSSKKLLHSTLSEIRILKMGRVARLTKIRQNIRKLLPLSLFFGFSFCSRKEMKKWQKP